MVSGRPTFADMSKRDESAHETHWRLLQESLNAMELSATLMRGAYDAINNSHVYRLYLLGIDGQIGAAESFSAEADAQAWAIARSIQEASNDVFTGYELWTGTKRIVAQPIDAAAGAETDRRVHGMIQAHQDTIADLEEKLDRAFACVRRSRKLVEAATKLRKERALRHAQGRTVGPHVRAAESPAAKTRTFDLTELRIGRWK
jgi:hypothetical protein